MNVWNDYKKKLWIKYKISKPVYNCSFFISLALIFLSWCVTASKINQIQEKQDDLYYLVQSKIIEAGSLNLPPRLLKVPPFKSVGGPSW